MRSTAVLRYINPLAFRFRAGEALAVGFGGAFKSVGFRAGDLMGCTIPISGYAVNPQMGIYAIIKTAGVSCGEFLVRSHKGERDE